MVDEVDQLVYEQQVVLLQLQPEDARRRDVMPRHVPAEQAEDDRLLLVRRLRRYFLHRLLELLMLLRHAGHARHLRLFRVLVLCSTRFVTRVLRVLGILGILRIVNGGVGLGRIALGLLQLKPNYLLALLVDAVHHQRAQAVHLVVAGVDLHLQVVLLHALRALRLLQTRHEGLAHLVHEAAQSADGRHGEVVEHGAERAEGEVPEDRRRQLRVLLRYIEWDVLLKAQKPVNESRR